MSVVRNSKGGKSLPLPTPPRCYVPAIQVAYINFCTIQNVNFLRICSIYCVS